jgi:PLP dependent protein
MSDAIRQLEQAFAQVTGRMAEAAARSGRRGIDVELVAVTKYASAAQLHHLVEMGHRDLGESRAQQLRQRAAEMAQAGYAPEKPGGDGAVTLLSGVRWHMIGHLQRNKAEDVAESAWMIHSVDSLRLARRLSDIAVAGANGSESPPRGPMHVLAQVNVSGEASKHGLEPGEAAEVIEQIAALPGLTLRGLMTMAPYSDDPEDARPTFAACRALFQTLRQGAVGRRCESFDTLSMGMSGDFEVAIEEGATVVRVGSALFNP